MNRTVLYVAHPLAPTPEELHFARETLPEARAPMAAGILVKRNIERAMAWLAWLRRSFPGDTFMAPWIASCLAGADDDDAAQREAGLRDACAVVTRCDGIVLCGPRISSGMVRERDHGVTWSPLGAAFVVYDLTSGALVEPPASGTGFDGPCPWTLKEWYDIRDKMRWSEVVP